MSAYPDYLNERDFYGENIYPPNDDERINDLKVEDQNTDDTSESINQLLSTST